MNNLRSPAPAASLFNAGNRKNNVVTNAVNAVVNRANTAINAVTESGPSYKPYMMLIMVTLIVATFAIFWRQIRDGFRYAYESLRSALGAKTEPVKPMDEPVENVTAPPQAPQDVPPSEKKLVEKVLPGRQEVYNISKNTFTYYDAEPLCKALGSELASYEQVKAAYEGGADWCNYGWVKGQMAVYPTQSETWQQLQEGPEAQRNACGRPGLNGGYFDNPELRFGVNCYGVKPDQKDHDATAVASGDAAPLSPAGLDFEKKVAKYRGEANSISILPFSKSAWSA